MLKIAHRYIYYIYTHIHVCVWIHKHVCVCVYIYIVASCKILEIIGILLFTSSLEHSDTYTPRRRA